MINSYLATEWFENNSMKLNQDKCHLLASGFTYENVWVKIGKTNIWESKKQKLLGVEIDTKGGSRTAATSKTERFVIIVNGFQPLTIITKHSILDVAAALDPPLDLKL